MNASATTPATADRDRRALSGTSVLKRLSHMIFAGIFLALTVALVPVAAIYSFIWLAKF